jgi:hypothetical protein
MELVKVIRENDLAQDLLQRDFSEDLEMTDEDNLEEPR